MNKCRPRIILISILFKKYALKLVSFYIASVCYSAKSPLVIFQAESYLVCYPKFYLSSSLVNVYLHLNNLFGPPKKEFNHRQSLIVETVMMLCITWFFFHAREAAWGEGSFAKLGKALTDWRTDALEYNY